MTNLRLSRSQLEKAIVAYIEKCLSQTRFHWVTVQARAGEVDENGRFKLTDLQELPLPCVAVAAPVGIRHPMGFTECELHVIVLGPMNKIEDDTKPEKNVIDPSNFHTELVGIVANVLGEEMLDQVRAAVNAPESGPDLRRVKDFRLFGYLPKDESSQETDTSFIDDFVYTAHSQPTDDTSL